MCSNLLSRITFGAIVVGIYLHAQYNVHIILRYYYVEELTA